MTVPGEGNSYMTSDVSGSPGQRNIQGSHRRDVNRVVCRWAERPSPSKISGSITTVDSLIKTPEPKGTVVRVGQTSRMETPQKFDGALDESIGSIVAAAIT